MTSGKASAFPPKRKMRLNENKRKRSENDFAHLMSSPSPSPDRAPDIWAHKPPKTFKRTATVLAKLGVQMHCDTDTWPAQDRVHRNLMADIKTHTQETFREGKKYGLWIGEQNKNVLRLKSAELQKATHMLRLKYNALEAKYDKMKKRLAACDYVHMADDDFMELMISSLHNVEPDPYLPEDSLYR